MSMEYCHYCDVMIDLDFNAEHFITHPKTGEILTCERQLEDNDLTEEEYLASDDTDRNILK